MSASSSQSSRSGSGLVVGSLDLDNYSLITASNPVEWDYEGEPIICSCKMMAPRWTSWTNANPGRRFYGCPNYKDPTKCCKFYLWHDPSLCDRGKEIVLELKAKEKLLHKEATFWKRQSLILKQNAADFVEAEIIEENARLKKEVKVLNNKIKEGKSGKWVKLFFALFSVVVICVFVKGSGNIYTCNALP
ncbi:Zinc finger, GRF-type [Corchorus olitorius]|uniref:Zinc finger, GRF-type n=1 Tax=Corchorus olitorius TaxID=93759 RepID=A0A1R3JMF8_9ROSI|nr:Zinc finger, GRF-type [Corchorus olitorius]